MSEGKRLAEISEVREKEDGDIVHVVEESVSIAQVEEIVENCKTGRCDCMTESTKTNLSEGYMHRTIGQSPFLPLSTWLPLCHGKRYKGARRP